MIQQLTTTILQINHSDEDVQRRGRNVIFLAIWLINMAMLFITGALAREQDWRYIVPNSLAIALYLAAIVLARRGSVTGGALCTILGVSVALFIAIVSLPTAATLPFYLLIPIMLAGTTLRGRVVMSIFALLLVPLWVFNMHPESDVLAMPRVEIVFSAFLLMLFTAILGALNASSALHSLRQAQRARVEAQETAAALERTNRNLEQRIAERTAALSAALEAQEAQARELQTALADQRRLNQLVSELSLPVIPVRDDVLVVPLVGSLDSNRSQQLLDRVLKQVQQKQARALLLDVTGVPVIDTELGRVLLQTAAATRLLGTRTMLVGIRPEVAQALVSLGIDFYHIETFATLQQGLDQLLYRQGPLARRARV